MSRTNPAGSPLPPSVLCQSLAGYVREHLATFERLLQSGTKYESLLQALVLAGFEQPSYTALDSALYRARRATTARKRLHDARAAPHRNDAPTASITSRVSLSPTADLKAEDLI